MTAATTDFDAFLDNLDGDHGDIYALFNAVSDVTDTGLFNCVEGNRPNTWLVRADFIDEPLFLASIQARQAFLNAIRDRFVDDDEMTVEDWHFMNRALENDRS
ncbi:hypothetical protein ACEUAF_19440 [Aeromonas veronii]